MAAKDSMAREVPAGPSRDPDKVLKQVTWPVLSGEVPPLAEPFSPRPETGFGRLAGLPPGQTAVLTPAEQNGSQPLAAMGGTGKTQLAVASARSFWRSGAAGLLAWVPASSRDAVLTGYAQAFDAIGVHDPRDDAETVAAKFLGWLAGTSLPWLVVLDDLAELADLEGLWPRGTACRTLITTRLPGDSLSGPGRTVVPVGEFSSREAVTYLATRLSRESDQRVGVVDLITELGGLPVALGQAASMIIDSGIDASEYRLKFADRRRQISGSDERMATISATWSLSLDHADNLPPAGLTALALGFIALLDPGVPGAVLASAAAAEYICAGQAAGAEADGVVRGVLGNLARAGLITVDPGSTAHTVRMHPLVRTAIRPAIPPAMLEQASRAAADALLQAWPEQETPPLLGQALRACTAALRQSADQMLWSPGMHPVLLRAGQSLDNARLTGLAVGYWRSLAEASAGILGASHASTLQAGDQLAAALEAAGRPGRRDRGVPGRAHRADPAAGLESRRRPGRAQQARARLPGGRPVRRSDLPAGEHARGPGLGPGAGRSGHPGLPR